MEVDASSERWRAFSLSDRIASDADSSWEARKERGNELLKAGDHAGALKLYRDAASLALGPLGSGALRALVEALETWPEGSPQRALADNGDLVCQSILSHLSVPPDEQVMKLADGTPLIAQFPNKGAAIAWSNHAQTLMVAGDVEGALVSARKATRADPSYVKGHHREMKALERLGRREEASRVQQAIRNYERARETFPAESIALLGVGWIGWHDASMVYNPARFHQAAEHVAAQLVPPRWPTKKVEVRASIVPFQGGQALMLTLLYGMRSTVECMDFIMLDDKNGDLADMPPNGHASAQTLAHAPMRIGVFIEDLAQWSLRTVAVMCGQGLVEHAEHVEEKLKEGHGGMHPPIHPDVVVYPAESTAAAGMAANEHGEAEGGEGVPALGLDLPDLAAMMGATNLSDRSFHATVMRLG